MKTAILSLVTGMASGLLLALAVWKRLSRVDSVLTAFFVARPR